MSGTREQVEQERRVQPQELGTILDVLEHRAKVHGSGPPSSTWTRERARRGG